MSAQVKDVKGDSCDFSDDDSDMLTLIESETDNHQKSLTSDQKARAEKNKLKALALKKARLQTRPYDKDNEKRPGAAYKEKKLVDTGGGFFIDEDEADPEDGSNLVTSAPPPLMPPDQPDCLDCGKMFADSHLLRTFNHEVCDDCKNFEKDGPHQLITKTDAKKEFLLKDSDFEKGEREVQFVPLKFVLRKNPHNPRWGDMKLFLRLQVEERALQVWGSEEALEKEHENREEKQVMAKTKKYEKKMKELRKVVRSSLFTKDISVHTHTFGEETYHEDKDEYTKECTQCGYVQTYEKM